MDLKDLKPAERQIEILHPGTKEPIGIRVSIIYIGDERLKKLKRQFQDERYRLEAKGKNFKAETFDNNANELSFAAMTGWEFYNPTGVKGDKGFDESKQAKFEGSLPEFNKKNAFAIFDKLPWFRDQIGEEMGDSEAFFPA